MKSLERRNNNISGRWERPLLAWLVVRLPRWIGSDALTLLGIAGAAVACLGFVLSDIWRWTLLLSLVGGVLNWFGDSLDGSVARLRGKERPVYGYFVDQAADLVSATIALVGLGLSPWVRLDVALSALVVYLLTASLTHMRAVVTGVYDIAPGRVGGTEIRLGLMALTVSMLLLQPRPLIAGYSFTLQDVAVAGATLVGAIGFLVAVLVQANATRKM